ncbi:MAG: hypothetical protein QXI19_02180 [Candidatus Caldarchaeum sp.]
MKVAAQIGMADRTFREKFPITSGAVGAAKEAVAYYCGFLLPYCLPALVARKKFFLETIFTYFQGNSVYVFSKNPSATAITQSRDRATAAFTQHHICYFRS